MIQHQQGVFRLDTDHTTYLLRVTPYRHVEHVYYGNKLACDEDMEALAHKNQSVTGTAVLYDEKDPRYCLDNLCLEWSGIGAGDFRMSPCEIRMPDGSFSNDFLFSSYEIVEGSLPMKELPTATGEQDDCSTLVLHLRDRVLAVEVDLIYTVYEACDVITRRTVVRNGEAQPLSLRKIMSMSLDMPDRGFSLITFDGAWIKEANRHDRLLAPGIYINSSTTGWSSHRHNPGFILRSADTDEDRGVAYGFNLIYSGNHYGAVELSNHDLVRVQMGINPHCFEWNLEEGQCFETPEAVLSFSCDGLNGLSHRFHDFVNNHIVRGEWKNKERPVLTNNWEATFFRFNRQKLLATARRAKKLGVELFVLDDGWFRGRDSDKAGLGDYAVNRKKLPFGIKELAGSIHRMGMKFGLWFEPEMINPDSDLYRSHPEYCLTTPARPALLSRNQLVLNLCLPEVREYIVGQVGSILDECGVDYVKWDCNRHISDAFSPGLTSQGEFFHRYILGLYEVLDRIFSPRPHILFESCASGGNRFDLGMLCFSPQIWTSDNTDPIARLSIQQGLSYLYPLSCMGAHVSDAPHQQTLRLTPLSTRYHVASFGCLGYEMDLRYLSAAERREIARQIAFYKAHRGTFQYGQFWRARTPREGQTVWHVVERDASRALTGFFQRLSTPNPGHDWLSVPNLSDGERYYIKAVPQGLHLRRFGGLVKHLLPFSIDPDGFLFRVANRLYMMENSTEEYTVSGSTLADGLELVNQYMGSEYNPQIRIMGDYGSYLYLTQRAAN